MYVLRTGSRTSRILDVIHTTLSQCWINVRWFNVVITSCASQGVTIRIQSPYFHIPNSLEDDEVASIKNSLYESVQPPWGVPWWCRWCWLDVVTTPCTSRGIAIRIQSPDSDIYTEWSWRRRGAFNEKPCGGCGKVFKLLEVQIGVFEHGSWTWHSSGQVVVSNAGQWSPFT